MKFLCDRCKTRYAIGDDRVRGKILKIRCKNCANVITVREGMTDEGSAAPTGEVRRSARSTTQAPPAEISTPAAAPNGRGALGAAFASAMTKPPPALEEEWYVSLDGEQEGPYSLAEAQRWVTARAHDADLHCWSEGFDDWLPVDKVSHFRGLRQKPTPPATPPPLPRMGSGPQSARMGGAPNAAPVEDEPKPLFAATMASLEKGVAAEPRNPLGLPSLVARPVARATPAEGVPARPGVASHAVSAAARAAASPARVAPRADTALGLGPNVPGFDLDLGDSATAISAPFDDDFEAEAAAAATAAQRAAFAKPAAAARLPEPIKPAVRIVAPEMPEAEVDEEGDLDIGEVSRVVNLADLLRPKAQPARDASPGALAAGRTTGATPSLRGNTMPVARIDMATGMPIAPLAPGIDPRTLSPLDPHYLPDQALVPPAHPSHRRMYIVLAVGALLLIGIVVGVVFVVNHGDDVTSVGLRSGPDYSTERPEDRIRRGGNQEPNPVGSGGTAQNPFLRPTQPIKPKITTNPNPIQELPRDQLSGDEIEAMAKKYEGLTARCFMRAGKGTNAILVGDVKRLVVTLTVAKDGQVTGVTLNEHQSDALGGCLVPMIKSWKFRPNGGGLFRITVAAPGN